MDAHVKVFNIVATLNGVDTPMDWKNIFGTTLRGACIDWYVNFLCDKLVAILDILERQFYKQLQR